MLLSAADHATGRAKQGIAFNEVLHLNLGVVAWNNGPDLMIEACSKASRARLRPKGQRGGVWRQRGMRSGLDYPRPAEVGDGGHAGWAARVRHQTP